MADILTLAADIVSAHVKNNNVDADRLPEMIRSVFYALSNIERPVAVEAQKEPAVPIRKSVTPDYLICLEDGKKLKMLKRYLMTNFEMTPDDYRQKWGLPADYPMVAPNYATRRSTLAKEAGLGRGRSVSLPAALDEAEPDEIDLAEEADTEEPAPMAARSAATRRAGTAAIDIDEEEEEEPAAAPAKRPRGRPRKVQPIVVRPPAKRGRPKGS